MKLILKQHVKPAPIYIIKQVFVRLDASKKVGKSHWLETKKREKSKWSNMISYDLTYI